MSEGGEFFDKENELHSSFHFPGIFLSRYFPEKHVNVQDFAFRIKDSLAKYFEKTCTNDDLKEFFDTGLSNNRRLRWDIMYIAPNTSFKLHAHPNIELIYVIDGAIHEHRLQVLFNYPYHTNLIQSTDSN